MSNQSPLVISNIILSQSESDEVGCDTRKDTAPFYQNGLQTNPMPVMLRIRRKRIFFWTFIVTVTIATLTGFLSRGIQLREIHISEMTQHQTIVQNYNAYVAALAALFMKPVQALTLFVLPVAFWCFLPERVMAVETNNSRVTKAMVYGVNYIIVWLISNSLCGVNVQLISTEVNLSVTPTDLLNTNAPETVFHSLLTPQYRVGRSSCSRPSPMRLTATIGYGFDDHPWMRTLLSSTISQSTAINKKPDNPSARFPIIDSFTLLTSFFQGSDPITNRVAAANISADIAPIHMIHTMFQQLVDSSTTKSTLKWIDTPRIVASFDSFNLSTDSLITFDSVTYDLPFRAEYMQRRLKITGDTTNNVSYDHCMRLNATSENDYYFDINVKEECGEAACIISPRNAEKSTAAEDDGPQVRILALCDDNQRPATSACRKRSSSSFFIFSFATHVKGESFMRPNSNLIQLKNARKIYSVTIGRMSWKASDLSIVLNQTCSYGFGCEGLLFPLGANRQLYLSNANISMKELATTSAENVESWLPLVIMNAQEVDMGRVLKSDLIFPRAFSSALSSLNISSNQCERERGTMVDLIVGNHWYFNESVQPAYTAALFWLFQGASVTQQGSSLGITPARLVIIIPQKSAIMTYCGCAILLVLSVGIFLLSIQKESHIEQLFQPTHLAQVLVRNSSPLVPSVSLLQCDLINVSGELLRSSENVEGFEIVSLTLRHRHFMSNIIHVPKSSSSNAVQ